MIRHFLDITREQFDLLFYSHFRLLRTEVFGFFHINLESRGFSNKRSHHQVFEENEWRFDQVLAIVIVIVEWMSSPVDDKAADLTNFLIQRSVNTLR